jgi:Glycosyltransferase family 87
MTAQWSEPPPRRTATYAALAFIAVLCLWFWVVAAHRIGDPPYSGFASVFVTGCGDFEHFYHAARAMREGRDLVGSGVNGYIYPPLIAFVFMPLTFLSVQTAALVMLIVNLTLALCCAWLASKEVARRFDIDTHVGNVIVIAAVTLFLAATKLRSELQMWQTNVPMMTAMLLALRLLDSRPRLAGALLGMAVNIKYLPLVYLPYLLLRRRFVAAAGFVGGIAAFALLPAVYSGWDANLRHWAAASAGMARLLGMAPLAGQMANVDPIAVGHSISITSGIARVMGAAAAPWLTWLAAGAVALAAALVLRAIYAGHGKPLMRWPSAGQQTAQPYLGMVALEWAALMSLTLAFSPQTNPRHTSLLLMAFAPLAAMLCFPKQGVPRWPAWAATAILFLGLVLPPNMPEFARQLQWWRDMGGAGWSMVLMLPFLFVAGFNHLDARAVFRRPVGQVAA